MSLLPETAIQAITAPDIDCLIVGLSGGLDSTALLHSLAQLTDRPPLKAIHINHGLQAETDVWQAHCEIICAGLGVALMCRRVEVAVSGSLETNARVARYQAFAECLGPRDRLLLAHHQQDQAETGLFQALRGHGAMGLLGMPQARPLGLGQLYRPLLDVPRAVLEAYAETHGLKYVSDPSNADQTHDRNFIRHGITPLLNERFQGWSARLARQISFDETARALLAGLGREDLLKLQTPGGYSVAGLQQLDQDRALNMLKTQLMDMVDAAPSAGQLRACLTMLASSGQQEPTSQAILGYEYHRHRNEFVLVPAIPVSRQDSKGWPFEPNPVDLGGVMLAADAALGGIDAAVSGLVWTFDKQGQKYLKGQNTKILDRLRAAKVPPWVRQRLPLLMFNGEVIAIPALPEWGLKQAVAEGFAAAKNSAGWRASLTRV